MAELYTILNNVGAGSVVNIGIYNITSHFMVVKPCIIMCIIISQSVLYAEWPTV